MPRLQYAAAERRAGESAGTPEAMGTAIAAATAVYERAAAAAPFCAVRAVVAWRRVGVLVWLLLALHGYSPTRVRNVTVCVATGYVAELCPPCDEVFDRAPFCCGKVRALLDVTVGLAESAARPFHSHNTNPMACMQCVFPCHEACEVRPSQCGHLEGVGHV